MQIYLVVEFRLELDVVQADLVSVLTQRPEKLTEFHRVIAVLPGTRFSFEKEIMRVYTANVGEIAPKLRRKQEDLQRNAYLASKIANNTNDENLVFTGILQDVPYIKEFDNIVTNDDGRVYQVRSVNLAAKRMYIANDSYDRGWVDFSVYRNHLGGEKIMGRLNTSLEMYFND